MQQDLDTTQIPNFFQPMTTELIKQIMGFDPYSLSSKNPYKGKNYVNGQWKESSHYKTIIDPLSGDKFISIPDTQAEDELVEFKKSVEQCPKSGLHNPFKYPERYVKYGEVSHRVAYLLSHPVVEDFFTFLIQRVAPKSDPSARAEVKVTQKFFMNFSGDQVRFTFESFNVSGDHSGQQSTGYRWPYGPVAIIAPFNFPLEIPALQLFGALIAGNKVVIKGDQKVSIVLEAFIKLMIYAGLPPTDVDLIHSDGMPMQRLIQMTNFRMLQFTGSTWIAEKLANATKGKLKIEDAGFDWKILGPDVDDIDYVCYQSDQDAYSFSGQKCSAQSMLIAHTNWVAMGLFEKLKELAQRRSLKDLTITPVLTWTNEKIQQNVDALLSIPGAKLLFGGSENQLIQYDFLGKPIEKQLHSIPECYGSYYPTAVFVPLEQIKREEYFDLVTCEVFGPLQVITEYDDTKQNGIDVVLQILEKIPHNLTAGVVSNDNLFVNKVLASTVNGVTYTGKRARTTGAPQNHWFGPCGDPRGTGIGTPGAIIQTWTSHREVVRDVGPIPENWELPPPS